jgi:mannose-6-phosphate isomerase-like protein (cupin superfamily)
MSVTRGPMSDPHEIKSFDRGHVDVVKIGTATINRNTFEPGWRWSTSVKPIAGTESCQAHHVGVILSGRLGVETDDGDGVEIGPGEAYEIEPGHDGWVVGDEPVISIEFLGSVA